MPVSVADDYDSDQSVYEEIEENFCKLPAKQRIQTIFFADRHKISSNALNDIIASIIRESQEC